MNGSIRNLKLLAIFFICIFFFYACAGLPHRISKEKKECLLASEAKSVISILKDRNHQLKTIKGVGRITFWEKENKGMTTRIAWVASTPDKIRLTLSSISGHPIISAASDGRWFTFISYAKGDFYKKRATDTNMKRFLSISITAEDMINVLSGRIPAVKYDSACFIEDNTLQHKEVLSENKDIEKNKHGNILVLKDREGNVREKMYLTPGQDAHKVEIFDSDGDLVYRVAFFQMKDIESYRVPFRLKASNRDGTGFQLDLDRYWVDTETSLSVFTLTPPN